MQTEQESWLRERLKEGMMVKELFPHKYYRQHLYYEIHFHDAKVKVVIVAERNIANEKEEQVELKIVETYRFVRGKKEVIPSSLLYLPLTLEPSKLRVEEKTGKNQVCLNGKVYLSAGTKKEEAF